MWNWTTIDGSWSIWGSLGACTVTCGSGQQVRTRVCNNPEPANGGAECTGENYDYTSCTRSECPGQEVRAHVCNNPTPANGGSNCQGEEHEYKSYTLSKCPVDGDWSSWGSFDSCSVTCGTGQQVRRRFCNSPAPANEGATCQGAEYSHQECTLSACPIDGSWSIWGSWGACPKTAFKKIKSNTFTEPEQSENIPVVVGTVTGVLVIVIPILILVLYAKRYFLDKSHIYGETHVNHTYQNDLQRAVLKVTAIENTHTDEANLVERYGVSDLTKRFRNKEYFVQSLQAEFKLLNNPASDPKPCNNEYEIVDTAVRKGRYKWSNVGSLYYGSVYLINNLRNKEYIYTLIELIVSENQLNLNNSTFKLLYQNNTTQKMRNVKMFKINDCKSPSLEAMCWILGKASEVTDASVLIINSKKADLSVCGVNTVCFYVIYSIKNGSTFSVLENAMVANKNDRGFFKNFYTKNVADNNKKELNCGQLCNTSRKGSPGPYFDHINADIDCQAIFKNEYVDRGHDLPHAPKAIPKNLLIEYTMNNRIPVKYWYFDNQYLGKTARQHVWTEKGIEDWIISAKQGRLGGNYGAGETNALRDALKHAPEIVDGRVMVIGSEIPWVEACVLEAGARSIYTGVWSYFISTSKSENYSSV
ncbi:HMCN [Mytilus coruscus]|uniref:HMCN n=1 Tax=Mytilus coruscus TaxID=42192 RepID=A0A6J8BEX0_MYTCO|nr:HMCN [Mytilus coruscus]